MEGYKQNAGFCICILHMWAYINVIHSWHKEIKERKKALFPLHKSLWPLHNRISFLGDWITRTFIILTSNRCIIKIMARLHLPRTQFSYWWQTKFVSSCQVLFIFFYCGAIAIKSPVRFRCGLNGSCLPNIALSTSMSLIRATRLSNMAWRVTAIHIYWNECCSVVSYGICVHSRNIQSAGQRYNDTKHIRAYRMHAVPLRCRQYIDTSIW